MKASGKRPCRGSKAAAWRIGDHRWPIWAYCYPARVLVLRVPRILLEWCRQFETKTSSYISFVQ
jgi:hypothetical protein